MTLSMDLRHLAQAMQAISEAKASATPAVCGAWADYIARAAEKVRALEAGTDIPVGLDDPAPFSVRR